MRPYSATLLLIATILAASVANPIAKFETAGQQLDTSQCESCRFFVQLMQDVWGDKTLEDCLGDFIVNVCELFKIEDNFICKGMVGDFQDEFLWVLGEIIVNPEEVCGLLLKDCGHIFNPLNGSWVVPLPGNQPPYQPPTPPKDIGQPKLRVLHLTDVHLDMYYVPGTEAKCSEPQCCRVLPNPNEVTDDDIQQPAGYWGTIGNCDAPYHLFTDMLQHCKDTHKDLDYILVSGDLMSHADWDYTRPSHQAMVKNISDTLREYFPNIPSYFAIGNHEGVPIDNFAPHFVPDRFKQDWLYDTMADSWKGWVPQDQDQNMRYRGSFTVKLFPGLRLISLNTPLGGDAVNFYLYLNQTDPDGTMTWFIDQLYDAEKAGDKVHVVAHIPGGSSESLEGWSINYYNAFNRFANTIVAQFFGHTHSEEFYVMYADPENSHSTPTGVIYSAPSITTYSEYNPAYRVYTLDGNHPDSQYGIIDFEEWFFNLTTNTDPTKHQWEQLYASVLTEYGLQSTVPSEWNKMVERMKTDDVLFNKYRKNYYRRDDIAKCDAACKLGWLCDCKKAHHSDKLCADLNGATGRNRAPLYRKEVKEHHPSNADVLKQMYSVRADQKCKL